MAAREQIDTNPNLKNQLVPSSVCQKRIPSKSGIDCIFLKNLEVVVTIAWVTGIMAEVKRAQKAKS